MVVNQTSPIHHLHLIVIFFLYSVYSPSTCPTKPPPPMTAEINMSVLRNIRLDSRRHLSCTIKTIQRRKCQLKIQGSLKTVNSGQNNFFIDNDCCWPWGQIFLAVLPRDTLTLHMLVLLPLHCSRNTYGNQWCYLPNKVNTHVQYIQNIPK